MNDFFATCWNIWNELAPWLLLGMVLAGLLHWLVPSSFIRRRFRGYSGVVSAVLLGVPLPLCSCGVIPAGIGLRKNGASDGSATAFLISTPQTGVDSIVVTAAFFGWWFAAVKVLAAIATGLAGGWIVEATETDRTGLNDLANQGTASSAAKEPDQERIRVGDSVRHSIEILKSIWIWLVIGVAVSAVIQLYIPTAWINSLRDLGTLPTMLVVLVFSLPVYVCATASIPIAAGLVAAGLPMSAGFVFLFAGPATNMATVGAVAGQLGRRVFVIYLTTLIVGGLLGGWIVGMLGLEVAANVGHIHQHNNWWTLIPSVFLLGLTGWFAANSLRRLSKKFSRPENGMNASAVSMPVLGMHCQNCADKLERAFKATEGVERVEVDLKGESVRVQGNVTPNTICDVIRNCGYQTETPDNLLVSISAPPKGIQ